MHHDLQRYADTLGFTACCEACGVHRTTFTRWLSGESKPPRSALELLRILSQRHAPGPEWDGWRLVGGWLYTPGGDKFHPGEIMATFYTEKRLDAYRREVAALKTKIARLSQLTAGAANDCHADFIAVESNQGG